MADCAACLLEVVTLVLAVALLRGWLEHGDRPRQHATCARLALVALVAVTALGLAGTPLAWFAVLVEGSGHAG